MESLASTKGPSVTILDLPRTTLPVPSNRSPACLKWPFFFRVSAQPIHFFVSCCICSGDMDRRAVWLCRNKYMKLAMWLLLLCSSLLLPADVAEHVRMDIQPDIGHIVQMLTGHEPDDLADRAFRIMTGQAGRGDRVGLFLLGQLRQILQPHHEPLRLFDGRKECVRVHHVCHGASPFPRS